MRKLIIATSLMLALLTIATALPSVTQPVAAQAPPKSYYPADCVAAGQGPGCTNTLFQDVGSVDLQSWNPTHDYETFGAEILALMYDTPVIYNGLRACADLGTCLAPGNGIASVGFHNGTYYTFSIIPGVHAYRLNSSGVIDVGVITASDWVYSIQRYIGMCEADGSAPIDGAFFWNATAWFTYCLGHPGSTLNQPGLLKNFNFWLNSKPSPVGVINSTAFYERVDATGSTVYASAKPYLPWLGNEVNSWAGVYPTTAIKKLCGDFLTQLATSCAFMDGNAVGIGSAQYLVDETRTSLPSKIVLVKNPHYCDVVRANGDCGLGATNSFGGPTQANRIGTIVFKTTTPESTRRNELLSGAADLATISATNLPFFLNASTTPVFNALDDNGYFSNTTGKVPDFGFTAYPTAVVLHAGLLYAAGTGTYVADNGHPSPLWGACFPTPSKGCLVRKGITYAIDYVTVLNSVFNKLGTQIWGFVPNGLRGNSTAAVAAGYFPAISQDLNVANASFHAAGYNSSHILTVTCAYNQESLTRQRWCQTLASVLTGLSDAGGNYIVVLTATATFGIYVTKAFVSADWDITTLGWFPDYYDQDNYARAYAPSYGTFSAPSGYVNATIDSQVLLASSTPNGPARDKLYYDIMRTLTLNYLYAWMPQPDARTVYLYDIKGFGLRGPNPAFLPFDLDLTKVSLKGALSVPVFGSLLGVMSLVLTSIIATFLLVKRTPRKIRFN